ncbi:hypothetical protein EDB83DRAFT_2316753 [Lactarius deliciosus]|nr:hypothetical protein EDB83DRAFT_2316753 [Lactarius deliciosus]
MTEDAAIGTSVKETKRALNYGGAYLINAVQAFQQQQHASEGPHEELQQYLKTGVESMTNVLGWWGGSSTPSERAFSSGGITDSRLRNKLQPAIFEALQLLKSAYWSGHISATTQGARNSEISILDSGSDLEDDNDAM